MERNFEKIRLFVASPGDVQEERSELARVVGQVNRGLGDRLGYVLEVVEWKQVAPVMGRPQGEIFAALPVAGWDLFVGILWLRFGTPTGAPDPETGREFESGTKEEFVTAYRAEQESGRPRILFYRCLRPERPDRIDAGQLLAVQDFFEAFNPHGRHPGLFRSFTTAGEFADLVRQDLETVLWERDEARLREREEARLREPEPAPPEARRLTFQGKEYVWVPPGPFTMGTEAVRAAELEGEGGEAFRLEAPAHRVEVAAFAIARTPVTNAEYAEFVAATGHPVPFRDDEWSRPYNWDPERRTHPAGRGEHPVVLVSWHDARDYCRWLGARLPTEAEWEKAARGTDGREWPWGSTWQEGRSNAGETSRRETTPVGTFSPAGDSPYATADMAGNVWEWTSSRLAPYPYTAADGREDPEAAGERVLRGGCLGIGSAKVRCPFRKAAEPGRRGFSIGFRVVLLDSEAGAG